MLLLQRDKLTPVPSSAGTRVGTAVDSQGWAQPWIPGTLELHSHLAPALAGVQHTALTPSSVLKQVLLPHAGDFKAGSVNPGPVSNKAELCAAGSTNETNSAVTPAECSARTQE